MKLPTYLNLDLESPGLEVLLDSVVADEQGSLSLARVHGGSQTLADDAALSLTGPATVAVAPGGDVYVADAAGDRVLRFPECGGDGRPVGCLARMLKGPRGVLAGPRDALYVADTGHDRIVVVDLATEQVRGIWGRPHDPYGSGPSELDSPGDLAADAENRIYVADAVAGGVLRLDLDGRIDPGFSLATAQTAPHRPEAIVTVLVNGDELLLVLDRVTSNRVRVLLYRLDGTFADRETRRLRTLLSGYALDPVAASSGGVVHVAEKGTGRILSFDADGRFRGVVRWQGEATGLAIDRQGRLLVAGAGLVGLDADRPAAGGTFRVGPIEAPFGPAEGSAWQLVSARTDPLPEGAHLQLFAWVTDDAGADPPALGDPGWAAAPLDAPAWRPPAARARFLWLGGRLTAGPTAGPLVRGLRVEFDREGWLRHLPAIYARESAEFLEPALAALEQGLRGEEDALDGLPALFDPDAAPAGALDWLASWLGYELEESFDEATRRRVIAQAFELQGARGTAASLRGAIELVLGARSEVIEPADNLSVWQLGDDSRLGFGTSLAAGEPDGAVVGTTAVLDRSSVERDEDYGAPLYEPTAHRFCVRVPGSDVRGPAGRAALERLVERERPAETEAHICVIEPRLRVGFQATVGLDAIVARDGESIRLGEEGLLGAGAALTDEPTGPSPGIPRAGRMRALI